MDRTIYDFKGYSLRDLMKIRDALMVLEDLGFGDYDFLFEVNKEIEKWEDKDGH